MTCPPESPVGRAPLKHGSIGLLQTIGQSIAGSGPTFLPALNISVAVGIAGVGTWLSYLLATVGIILVAANIAELAKRHPQAGSYFLYIGRTLGPLYGATAGCVLVISSIIGTAAISFAFPIFLENFLTAFSMSLEPRALNLLMVILLILLAYAAYREIQLSSGLGLALEAISISIIILIVAFLVAKHGTMLDRVQLNVDRLDFGRVMSALPFAIFSFVGFESAASLAKESTNPRRNIPIAITGCTALIGCFFVLVVYCMMMVMNDHPDVMHGRAPPLAEMTAAAGIPWASGIIYLAAMFSAAGSILATLIACSRLIYSMGRYGLLHRSLGTIHTTHKTPHVAVLVTTFAVLVTMFGLIPLGSDLAFDYAGTFATYGFILIYLLVCIAAPIDARRAGLLCRRHIVVGVGGTALMTFVLLGSIFPVRPYPYDLLPPGFVLLIAVGGTWFSAISRRRPSVMSGLDRDLEG
jgi:amino acid transporter